MSGLDSYLEEIKQYPILDAAEEKELAIRIANDDEFAKIIKEKISQRLVSDLKLILNKK